MKHPEAFRLVMQSAFERASQKYMQKEHQPLSLRRIAQETGIEVSVLSRLGRGLTQPETGTLFHLLVYLGCDENERNWIFHLAELATPEETHQAVLRAVNGPSIIPLPAPLTAQPPQRVLDRLELEVLSLQAPSEQPTAPRKTRSREPNRTKKATDN